MPEETGSSVERIWMIKPGEAPGQLWAGVAHAALFESRDDGLTWTLNDALWKERVAGDWQPGAGGLALHSICPWPGDPQRMAIGVSAAGVWITEDGGQSWRTGYPGLTPLYMPEEERENTNALCVHNMHRAPTRPERLFLQFHGSVYRSDDEGGSWNDIQAGLPSGFGFPLVVDPARPRQRVRDPAGRRRGPRHTRGQGPGVRNPRRRSLLDRTLEEACLARTPTSRSTGRRSALPGRAPTCSSTSAPPAAMCSARPMRAPPGSRPTNGWRRSRACGSHSGVPAPNAADRGSVATDALGVSDRGVMMSSWHR